MMHLLSENKAKRNCAASDDDEARGQQQKPARLMAQWAVIIRYAYSEPKSDVHPFGI